MISEPLATVLRVAPENIEQLIAEGALGNALDLIYDDDTWMRACISAIREAPSWLTAQLRVNQDDAFIPNLIGERKGSPARAAFLAQSAAAAAARAWEDEDAVACLALARRAAHWWSIVDEFDDRPLSAPARPLATLRDSLRAERPLHDPQAWAPVEEMVIRAADRIEAGLPVSTRVEVKTWIDEQGRATAAKLLLEAVSDAQPGLWRAPSAGLTLVDELFLASLRDAWSWATARGGLDPHVSVRWRLLREDGSRAPYGNGDAIGLACAVGLQQLAVRHQRLNRLDRRTSYLAAVSADGTVTVPATQILPASGPHVHVRRLVAAATQSPPPAKLALRRAEVVKDAVRHGRQPVRNKALTVAAAACAVAASVLIAGFALATSRQSDSRNSAAASAHTLQSEAAALASDAQAALGTDPPRAIAAAAAAYRLAPHNPAVVNAVIATAADDPRARYYLSPVAGVQRLSLSADGRLLAALLDNGKIEAWSLAGQTPRVLPIIQPPGITSAIGFVGDGSSLAAVGTYVSMVDPLTGGVRRLARTAQGTTAISTTSLRNTFVTASASGVRLWDITTGASRLLTDVPVATISLAPDGRTVLAGGDSGTVRLLSAAGGVEASASLPARVTSVLLGASGGDYAVTSAGRLYGLGARLRRVSAIGIPPDTTLTLRPGTRVSELTPAGLRNVRTAAQVVATASNAALLLPDDPAQIATGSGSSRGFNAVAMPIRGLGQQAFATDSAGRLAATVLSDGQIRVSTIDLAGGPPLLAEDVASAAIVSRSTIAITTGLLHPGAITALVNRTTGRVTSSERFTRSSKNIFLRPITTSRDVITIGSTTSSVDVWRIHAGRLATAARNLAVSTSPVSALAVDDDRSLLFVAAGTDIQVRRVISPARQISNVSTTDPIGCLATDPARHALYACTRGGIMAFTYDADGQLHSSGITDSSDALGLAMGPAHEVVMTFTDGNATLLSRGFGAPRADFTLATNDSVTLAAAATPAAAVISGENSQLYYYSTATGTELLDSELGSGQFVTALWPAGGGTLGGVTLDGSLFTLPPTSPPQAVRYSCALIASPAAQWRADFGSTPAAKQLPASGGC